MNRTNLRYSDLRGVDLTGTDLRGALVDEATILPVGYAIGNGRVVRAWDGSGVCLEGSW
ncbi:pentapeptide repeat-containing protein [Ferrimicrobium sp.]|uniref:pentapeptide repeat-containing protein n=1 Tax=Ferrimicrobium sp. TaxID=2926050 RepID=UPI00345D4CC2